MLDAKQAILEEHHRRFLEMQKEGRWEEALQQYNVTLQCAAGLLQQSLQVLKKIADKEL
jgi:hypothetical protein